MSPVQEVASEMSAAIVAAAQPRRIILFGSHASGGATDDSDFDPPVVVKISRCGSYTRRWFGCVRYCGGFVFRWTCWS